MSVPARDGAASRASPDPKAKSRSGVDRREAADVRLVRLEAKFDSFLEREVVHLATKEDVQKLKEDVQKLKVWVLSGVIGGMIAAAGIATGIAAIIS